MKPCKHLDYDEEAYTDCTLKTMAPHYPDVRYWERGERWTDDGLNPKKIQFCKLYGRVNAVFDCYDGTRDCYEPVESAVSATEDGGES